MFVSELFALLEHTADSAYTVTDDGVICSWNSSAVQLFGYTQEEAVGQAVDAIFDARDTLGTEALAGGMDAVARRPSVADLGIPSFDLEVRTRAGDRLWVNVSTMIHVDARTGRRLVVRLMRDISLYRRQAELLRRFVEVAREVATLTPDGAVHAPVEALSEQETRILQRLADGESATTVARQLRISPQTLRNHLHRINRKLRTHTRLEAVTHARRRGLIA